MRLGVDEVGVTELMGVAEHAQCLGVVAAALLLDAGATACLVQPVDPSGAPEPVREVLEEIRCWGSEAIGTDEIPTIWRAIARNPHYIQSTWLKEQVVMRSDRLSARDKRRVALAIAMNGKSRYMIEYHVAILRRLGDTDEDLLEVLGVVDHYNCLNTLSDGMQIVSDIRPPA